MLQYKSAIFVVLEFFAKIFFKFLIRHFVEVRYGTLKLSSDISTRGSEIERPLSPNVNSSTGNSVPGIRSLA